MSSPQPSPTLPSGMSRSTPPIAPSPTTLPSGMAPSEPPPTTVPPGMSPSALPAPPLPTTTPPTTVPPGMSPSALPAPPLPTTTPPPTTAPPGMSLSPPPAPPLNFAPPPAPPPPAPQPPTVLSSTVDDSVYQAMHQRSFHEDVALKAYTQVGRDSLSENDSCLGEDTGYGYLSVYSPCTPLIQNGPRCGLVAMAMAVELLGEQLSPDDVYRRAKTLGFTKQGEMFSVADMARLCEDVTPNTAKVVHPREDHTAIIRALLCGWPILMPYDADRNHRPCEKKGHKAHWAVLSGLFMKVSMGSIEKLRQVLGSRITQVDSIQDLYLVEPGVDSCEEVMLGTGALNPGKLWVYGQQGKSRHTAVWLLWDLITSNDNLMEVDPEKSTNPNEWVQPKGGLRAGLKNQAIVVTRTGGF